MDENENDDTIVLAGGGVEYSMSEARIEIDDLIAALEDAKSEGATHVVMSSGNYRGAQWARIGSSYDWASDLA
jgi:pyruvate-formate lyase-activating enzyme